MNMNFGAILRWIAILPGAISAGVLANFPLHWWLYGELAHGEIVSGVNIGPIEYAIFPFVISTVYIWAGSVIAPKFKREVSVALALLYGTAFVSLFVLFPDLKPHVSNPGGVAGVILGLCIVWKASGRLPAVSVTQGTR